MINLEDIRKKAEAAKHNSENEKCIECDFPFKLYRHRYGCSQPELSLYDALYHSTILELLDRLKSAEDALGFYAHPESWIIRDGHEWKKSSPKTKGDEELIKDYKHPIRDWTGSVSVGGKLAREHFKRWGGV